MGLAFLIAFAAFLINGHQRRAPEAGAVQDAPERDAPLLDRGPLIMAGIAAGIAVSVKVTFLVPVVAIPSAWSSSAAGDGADDRLGDGLSMFVVGGYWYVRAAIKTGGNPIPITSSGRCNLPTPDQMPLDPRPRFAVAHYLTEPTIYRALVLPPARQRLRPALAADPDRRRRRRGLHRRALAQPDPAGDRRRRPRHRGRLRLHAADRGRAGGLADRVLHQHPVPDAGAGAGDGAAADRAAAAGARPARLADAALPHRGLRDHGADDAALVPGLHRRHGLPDPGPGLGARRPRRCCAARGQVSRGAGGRRRPPRCCFWPWSWGRAQRSSTPTTTTRARRSSSRKAGRRRPTTSPACSRTSGSGSPAPARSSSASTASTAADLTNYVQYIGVPGPHGSLPPGDQLSPVQAPDQRRRLRLPDPQPVHTGRRPLQRRSPNPFQFPIYAWVKNDPALKLVVAEPKIVPEPDYVFKVDGKLDPASCK